MGLLTTLIHLVLAVHYGYGIHVYLFGLSPPGEVIKLRTIGGGAFKYLTFWDMVGWDTYCLLYWYR